MLFHYLKFSAVLVLIGGLTTCSNPRQSPPAAYPGNEAVSTPQGVPRNSSTSYFPVEAGENPNRIVPRDSLEAVPYENTMDCKAALRYASQDLFSFHAPVLSNFFLERTTYRFLWSPSFQPPVLLTLTITNVGGLLTTQYLNKQPGWTATAAEQLEKQQHIAKIIAWVYRKGALPSDTARLESARTETELLELIKSPLKILRAPHMVLTQGQVRHFRQLLAKADFWQLPGCQPIGILDGANWLLEAHEPTRYHIVARQSPDGKNTSFRQCCEFLLELSPAKTEERY